MFIDGQKLFVIRDQCRDDGIVLMQQKVMIEQAVDKTVHTILDVGKIADHTLLIERILFDGNTGFDAMSVQVSAFARMIH